MSELRKQLQQAKAEYESIKYPGDLAFELLAPERPIGRIIGWSAVGVGIAAAIALWVMHGVIVTQPGPAKPTAIATKVEIPAVTQAPATPVVPAPSTAPTAVASADESIVPVADLPDASEFPSDMSFVPSGESIVPSAASLDIGAMPSMPSMPPLDMSEETTSKESA
jgi:hypothetical protein